MDTLELKSAVADIEKTIDAQIKKMNTEQEAMGQTSTKTAEDLELMLKSHNDLLKSHNDMVKALNGAKNDVQDLMQKQVNMGKQEEKALSVGELFVKSEQFKSFSGGSDRKVRVEVKNTILNSGHTVSRYDQLAGAVAGAFRRLTVMPTVSMGATTSNSVEFSRELLWTNNAAGTAEGATKPESVLTFEEVTTPVRTIAHFIKVSKQALADSTFLASYIDRRLSHGINNKVEQQIISGDGTGQNLSGWLASGNSTVTSPLLTTDIYGLASKMKAEIIAADYEPDYFYINPVDWAAAETVRRSSGDAGFVAASGAVNYVNNGLTALLWGLPVVETNNVPAGTLICKSQDADMYAQREGTVVEMFEQDGDNVQTNLVTVRAETRGAELNFVPAAIRTGDITAITAPA